MSKYQFKTNERLFIIGYDESFDFYFLEIFNLLEEDERKRMIYSSINNHKPNVSINDMYFKCEEYGGDLPLDIIEALKVDRTKARNSGRAGWSRR